MGPRRRAVFVHAADTSLHVDLAFVAARLVSEGCSVAVLTDFREARRYIRETAPHLLVTDVRLGAYNGLHLVVAALARRGEVATVVIAEAVDEPLRREAERLGATFLLRPLSSGVLYEVVVRLVDCGNREMPPAYAGG